MHFLQSPEWEQFQQSVGRRTWRAAGVLLIEHSLPYGFKYLYAPRPEQISEDFFIEAEKIAKAEGAISLKIDPEINSRQPLVGSRQSNSIQPRKTIIIDLHQTEE